MKEVKTNAGMLRLNRNLSLAATTGCLIIGGCIATGNIVVPIEACTQTFCSAIMGVCSVFPGVIAYKNHKQLKKIKRV